MAERTVTITLLKDYYDMLARMAYADCRTVEEELTYFFFKEARRRGLDSNTYADPDDEAESSKHEKKP